MRMLGSPFIWAAAVTVTLALATASGVPASAEDYLYVHTESGRTRCSIGTHEVLCVSQTLELPVGFGNNAAQVDDTGKLQYLGVGMVGDPDRDIVLHYGETYHLQGWTLLPTDHGTRFTNDRTGHGMFVSVHGIYSF